MTNEQTERLLAALENIAHGLTEIDETLTRMEVAFLVKDITPGNRVMEQDRFHALAQWFIPEVKTDKLDVLEDALRARLNLPD